MNHFKKNISRYRKSKNAKVVAENFIALSILKIIGFLFPLITMPYLARVIGADGFGAIAFSTSIMIFVETITDWGFGYTATRDVAKCRENLDKVSEIYSEVIFAKLLLMFICLITLCLCIWLIPSIRDYCLLLILTFSYIPGHIFFPEWMFQAFEKMKYITIINVISKLLFTILVFVVIKEKSDYVLQPLLTACGYFLSAIFAQYVLFKKLGVKLYLPSIARALQKLKDGADMFISQIMPNLYNNFSTILLKSFCGDTATGIYSAGQKFESMTEQISRVLSRAFFPFLARHKERHHVYAWINGGLSIFMCIVLFSLAGIFVHLFYTPEFDAAVIVIRIFALSPFFLFLSNTYGQNFLVIIGKERIFRNVIIICSLIGAMLTAVMTPQWGYIGAAVSITLTRGIIGFSTYICAKKVR